MASFKKKLLKKNESVGTETTEERIYSLNDYDETFVKIKKVLWILGLRLTRNDSDRVKFWFQVFYWFEFANLLGAVILEIIELIRTVTGGSFEDIIASLGMIPCMGYLISAILKSYKICYYESMYENLINELRNMWPQGKVTEDEHVIISKALKQLNFVTTGFYWCNYALIIGCMLPCYTAIIQIAFGQDVPKILAYLYWLPFDPLQPYVFEVLIIIQSWHTILSIMGIVSGDLLFFIFVSHITTQFDLMSLRIEKLIFVPTDQQLINIYPLAIHNKHKRNDQVASTEMQNEEIREDVHQKELLDIILRHRTLIRLCADVESLFSFSLLINFINSSVIICFLSFVIVVVEKWYEFMYKTAMVTILSQTWLICWFGQKLLDSSKRLSQALYNCGWYTSSQKIKKNIQIMLFRTGKAVGVTTYGFTIICLASYTTIIKTSWSYFTLIYNSYKMNQK
ncbi:odorant receptor 67c isoform X2 [Galleria mellonella]|uniref:Odorant receptor n=1 Tax=Galleria mellonella TaxID=7137 RepID=A0A6J3BUL4_GALME|nr:odorant receptor 67c isoform X2 [Galleria mellonella]